MDTFVDSSWYQYRYLSPDYDQAPFDPEIGRYWLPVDQYTGGIEHATMHLLYTRFFTKAMRDIGLVDFDEPMVRLFNQGIILGEDSEKMSKSRGNVVDPDDLVSVYGADTFRGYLIFIGPWNEGGPWNSQGIEGVHRFLSRVWDIVLETADGRAQPAGEPSSDEVRALQRITHQTIRQVTRDMEAFKFNTMLAAMMKLSNHLMKARQTPVVNHPAWKETIRSLVLMLAPPCPHIAEELWMRLGGSYSVHQQAWPEWDEELARDEVFTLVLQINGKLRDRVDVPVGITEEEAHELALSSEKIQRHLGGKEPRRTIYVPGRLVNIVV